jgi:hypothetical protein
MKINLTSIPHYLCFDLLLEYHNIKNKIHDRIFFYEIIFTPISF